MIAQSVADILGRHVRLAVEGIDRIAPAARRNYI
jgi:hypothetical protein